ncbi:MAG: GNAT family N-acetyltransferase [Geodermatophilaceae bacterium]|nr:GNAT family N-acetyltransferase [Geodermatophilaceae bacterium]
MTFWSVRRAAAGDAVQIDDLLRRKAARLEALDRRLLLPRRAAGRPGLVAVDGAGTVAGHLRPHLVELTEDDEMRSFAAARVVSWRELAAASPEALAALVDAARVPGAADAALWPAVDGEAPAVFARFAMKPVFVLALRTAGPLPSGPAATVRLARPGDLDAVCALHLEEVAFHEPHTPYVRVVPALVPALRSRLEQLWSGADDASTVHVLEVDGVVAGMCESHVQTVSDEGGQLLPGRYSYLNSVAVGARLRGQGFGRTLVSAVIDDVAARGVDGYTLWFALDNPLARQVWPRLGFRPLWISYERRDLPV